MREAYPSQGGADTLAVARSRSSTPLIAVASGKWRTTEPVRYAVSVSAPVPRRMAVSDESWISSDDGGGGGPARARVAILGADTEMRLRSKGVGDERVDLVGLDRRVAKEKPGIATRNRQRRRRRGAMPASNGMCGRRSSCGCSESASGPFTQRAAGRRAKQRCVGVLGWCFRFLGSVFPVSCNCPLPTFGHQSIPRPSDVAVLSVNCQCSA